MLIKREILLVAVTGLIINIYAAPHNFITKKYNFNLPEIIEQANNTCRVILDNSIPDNTPSCPTLPQFGVSFEIPDGYEVEDVTLITDGIKTVQLISPVEWGQPPYKPGDQPLFCDPDPLIYLSNELYPVNNAIEWRTDPTGTDTLFSLHFAPLQYNPLERKLLCSTSVTVHISLIEQKANINELMQKLDLSASPLDPTEHYDYLIISTSNMIARAAPPYDFDALLSVRRNAGFITKLLPVEWIYNNYTGADQPEQIRHFLQDAHAIWGLKYLLIAATHQLIPTRKLYIAVPTFGFTYTEEIPADHIYYGCMTGSYDGNGNGRYGEYNDGDGGGDVDLTAEIMTGRFPVENQVELSHMIRKTLCHEDALKASLFNNGFISEKVDFGNIVYGEPFMEEIRNGSTTYGKINLGYTNSPYDNDFITTNNLHDSDGYLFNKADCFSYLTNNLYSINHLGHGATYQCLKLNVLIQSDYSNLAALQNPFPYFLYSQACNSGAFDSINCFAEQMVTVSNAAAAVVMNSRNGWASTASVSGYSHFFHRHFWDGAFRGNATTYGEMNEYARRMNLSNIPSFNGSFWRWVYYELNLFGDPAMPVMPAMLNVNPAFTHAPLINTYNTETNYPVRCHVDPIGIFDPESVFLTWSCNAEAGVVHTQQMERAEGNLYQSSIPPRPIDSLIQYNITATNRAGYVNSASDSSSHMFYVTDELNLNIIGSPFNTGICEPDYGSYSSASGLVIEAVCNSVFYESEAIRHVNNGFIGTGSVPAASTNQFVVFQIDMNSMIIWLWQKEYRVRVNSNLDLPPESIYWVKSGTYIDPPEMPRFIADLQSNEYAFAGWELDEVRSPALPQKSIPKHPQFNVSVHHELTAIYITADQDVDGNAIADWWELQYFGLPGQDIFADNDQDGYDIYQEFEDLSDPLDPQSFPAPPLISHTPLASIQSRPGPFEISVLITDTHEVSDASVIWRIRDGEWQSNPLNLISNDLYQTQIAEITTPGDNIQYWIEARDPSANLSRSATFDLFLSYPVADFSDFIDLFVLAKPDCIAVTNRSYLFNRGNSQLNWNLSFGKEEKFLSPQIARLYNWDTESIEQPWIISTNHTHSPPYSMHATLHSTKGSAHHASITMPAVTIGANAQLTFAYWIDAEISTPNPTRAYDGGIVEYSIDGGQSYQQLSGPYTHEIYGWAQSPWPNETPCLSGLSFGWKTALFNLISSNPDQNGFEGQSVIFRFVYGGDDNTDHEGWYVDDILISPAAAPSGFICTLPEIDPYTTAPGYLSEMLWRNLPQIIAHRDENTTVILTSNAPTNSMHSFYWQSKIRQEPKILSCSVSQITNGNGSVDITTTLHEVDKEPLTLTLEWSDDRGHNWQSTPVTNINTTPFHTNISEYAPNGMIEDIPGATNSIPVTNTLNAIWNSAAPEAAISWSSNIYMCITASSPWFETELTKIFEVDNLPPQFTAGTLAAEPQGMGGDYLLTTNLIALEWPVAVDTPDHNPIFYTLSNENNIIGIYSNATSALISMTNRLGQYNTIVVVPTDPIGNSGELLELTALILNPQSDYDQDGATTAQEEVAGTDANNPQSVFIIKLFGAEGAESFNLSWTSVSGRSYTVESTLQLTNAAWTEVEGLRDIPGTGGIISVAVPQNRGAAFFRVVVKE